MTPWMNIINCVTMLGAGFTLGSLFTAWMFQIVRRPSWPRTISAGLIGVSMGIVAEKLVRPFL